MFSEGHVLSLERVGTFRMETLMSVFVSRHDDNDDEVTNNDDHFIHKRTCQLDIIPNREGRSLSTSGGRYVRRACPRGWIAESIFAAFFAHRHSLSCKPAHRNPGQKEVFSINWHIGTQRWCRIHLGTSMLVASNQFCSKHRSTDLRHDDVDARCHFGKLHVLVAKCTGNGTERNIRTPLTTRELFLIPQWEEIDLTDVMHSSRKSSRDSQHTTCAPDTFPSSWPSIDHLFQDLVSRRPIVCRRRHVRQVELPPVFRRRNHPPTEGRESELTVEEVDAVGCSFDALGVM